MLMAPLVALKPAAPLTLRAVLAAWVMLPAAVTVSAPFATAMLPRLRALLFARVALPAAVTVRLTAPLKALAALARLMVPFVAVKLAAPPPARAVLAAWLILPVLAVTLRLPAAIEAVPRLRDLLFARVTSLAPVLASPTAPLKALAAALRLMA